MRPSSLLLFVPAVLVFGSGIAALPYAENDLCFELMSETGPQVVGSTDLLPYGTRCAAGAEVVVHAPSTWELLASLLAVAALLGFAVARRASAAARGVAVAVAVLGLFGLLMHQVEYAGAAFATVAVLGPPLAYATDALLRGNARRALIPLGVAVLTPLAVVVAWTLPAFFGFPLAGAVTGVLAAVLLATLLAGRRTLATA